MTQQRMVILEELRRVNTHPSADEIYAMVRRRLPRVSLGTIYRNLEVLSASGEIQRLDSGSSLKRFDGRAERHYHIRCDRCDRLADLFFEVGLDLDARAGDFTDFSIVGHKLEFVGICPDCRRAAEDALNAATNAPRD
jgi:Fur family transcriptional regulator, ferric uptake regulator